MYSIKEIVLLLKAFEGGIAVIYSFIKIKQLWSTNGLFRKVLCLLTYLIAWLGVSLFFAQPNDIGRGTGVYSPFDSFMREHGAVSLVFNFCLMIAFCFTSMIALLFLQDIVFFLVKRIKNIFGSIAYGVMFGIVVTIFEGVLCYIRYADRFMEYIDAYVITLEFTFIIAFIIAFALLAIAFRLERK